MGNKADFANRPDLIKAVIDAETPNDCHKIDKLIDKLSDLDDWPRNHVLVVMASGVKNPTKCTLI